MESLFAKDLENEDNQGTGSDGIYKVVATSDMTIESSTWTDGQEYQVTETEEFFTVESNNGPVAFPLSLKKDLMPGYFL